MAHPCKNNHVIDISTGDIVLEDSAVAQGLTETIDTGNAVVDNYESLDPGAACSTGCEAPVFVEVPYITFESLCVGEPLSLGGVEYTGTAPVEVAYRWKRNDEPIVGATSPVYLTTEGDLGTDITCTITLTNACGEATATTDYIDDVATVPQNIGAPTILEDGLNLGDAINVTDSGTWTNGDGAFTYQWLRDGSPIVGQTTLNYIITADDYGTTISCYVYDSNTCGLSAPAESNGIVIPIP